ncbi:Phosphatidylinositol-3,4,5-trisphosphate 3-phosphatase [Pelomyxa schiedti]|nr:Phosphatidylinositol-3,4,5-trisphosphate 3-phosphatase [Pelomyxa schiedti]
MSGLLGLVRSTFSADIVRFRDGKFDLDLTYITNDMRVIAMGFPADGIESAFRNNIFELSKMLKERHGAHFMIWNLSGRKYDYDLFDNQILEFPFPDHHNPPLEKLFKIVKSMDSWIKADYQNTCVVHCLAGRGRTGTVISCYLNYSGMFTNAVDALAYFGKKRSMTETGVSQPSQIRYVEYFTHCLKGFMPFPRKKILRMVKFGPLPPFLCTQPLPVIDIYDMSTYPARLLRSTSSLASNSATSEIFSFTNGKLIFRLNDVVQGDVMVTLSSPTWFGAVRFTHTHHY